MGRWWRGRKELGHERLMDSCGGLFALSGLALVLALGLALTFALALAASVPCLSEPRPLLPYFNRLNSPLVCALPSALKSI